MHLKALTLRGFKSFASATTLRFEPGITCVVGPNGSGKSNVVDALSWVMGEQGAKSLRGGKMEDVIFAGTTGRPPLGRAEVSLTIDNSDGALPIEYAEVTITRIMFRNGGSEYQINGDTCRLLDIQELLSDSGIGREMHVIVGQGQLDSVLHADPMGRRAFIEEAAGVLKHRKRKEKALRKLDAMQANLARVQDLTDELRRQLKPLGRQAAVARRAAVIQADLRDARLRLLADDLVRLRDALQAEIADEAALKERKEAAEQELGRALRREADLEDEVRRLAPRLQRAQQTWYDLSQLAERVRGTVSLADARVKSATSAPPEERRGRDPEELEREAARVREQEAELEAALEAAEHALEDTVAHRADLERELAQEERRLKDAARAIADRREGLARLGGQVGTARSRAASAQAEIERLAEARDASQERAAAAQEEYETLQAEVDGLDADDQELAERHEAAKRGLAEAEAALAAAREEATAAERARAATQARHEALALGLRRKDGTGAVLAAGDRLAGLLGPVAELLTVTPMPSPSPSADLLPGYPAADRWRRVPRTGQHYVDSGTGPPVLLLHGNPSWSYQWRHLIAALSPDFRCVAPDLAGLGLSPRPRVPASSVDRHLLQLDHLDALFDHLVAGGDVPRDGWTLVLHDWGAPLGWAWARRRSLRPARVVVLNSVCFPWPSGYRLPVYLRWIRDHRGVAALAHATNFFPRAAVRGGVVTPLRRAERRAYLLPRGRGGVQGGGGVLRRSAQRGGWVRALEARGRGVGGGGRRETDRGAGSGRNAIMVRAPP
ncbi:alpha/beta fold hydrolase, partial [Streptomyces olivaceus]|uniref:alpha/beta fold hydrolase n=1 Tax=Streptomyces olivaceus TaxID=47716 RepID=UPI00365596EB